MNQKAIPITFSLLLIAFGTMLASFFSDLLRGRMFMFVFLLIFILGGLLLFLTIKQQPKKPLKKFLLLTSGSAVGFFAFAVIHNLFYALEMITKQLPFLSRLAGILHALAFIISTLVCPIGFLIGIVGTTIFLLKSRMKNAKRK